MKIPAVSYSESVTIIAYNIWLKIQLPLNITIRMMTFSSMCFLLPVMEGKKNLGTLVKFKEYLDSSHTLAALKSNHTFAFSA